MTTTPTPAPALAAATANGTGTVVGMVSRRTSSRNASSTRPDSPQDAQHQQPSLLQSALSIEPSTFTGFLQNNISSTTAAPLSNGGARDDVEHALGNFQFAPAQRGRQPGPSSGTATRSSAPGSSTPSTTAPASSSMNAVIGATFSRPGTPRSFHGNAQQQADKQSRVPATGAQVQGFNAPQDVSTNRPSAPRTPSLRSALAGSPSPSRSQERGANANSTTTSAQSNTNGRGDGFVAPQRRTTTRGNTPSGGVSSGAANPAAVNTPTTPTTISSSLPTSNGSKRTRSQTRGEISGDDSSDSCSSAARARKAQKIKVEGPESLFIGKQSRDLLDNIGAVATERDELKHTTENLSAMIEQLEQALTNKEAELARVKRQTRDIVQKAQRSVQTVDEIKQDWHHQQANYDVALDQLREEKNLLSDERKVLNDFLHGENEGSLLSVSHVIQKIRNEGFEAFRLASQSLEDTKVLLLKEKETVANAEFDRAHERDRANDLASELHASVAKYELKSKEVAEMLKQVEQLKAERRVLQQRELDLLEAKAEASEKSKEQKAQLEAAGERESKLHDKIEQIEQALADKTQELGDLERRCDDLERRLAATQTELEVKQEELEEQNDAVEEHRKEYKKQRREIEKLNEEKADLQSSLEDAYKNIESHQKSITALTEHRTEAADEIRQLKRKVQAFEEESSKRQRNEVQADVLKSQLDEARQAKSEAEAELNRLRIEDVTKSYRLERAQDQEKRLQETINELKAREAKLHDDLEQRDAARQSLERDIQAKESQLAKSRDQADKLRGEVSDRDKALNETRNEGDKHRAEEMTLKLELERFKEAHSRLDDERARGAASLVAEQQKSRKLEQDLQDVTRGRATVIARYDAKQLESWEIELLDHADSRRYVELREQLAEKDKVNQTLSGRINEMHNELAANRMTLDQSRKQCASLMRSQATAQAMINAGGSAVAAAAAAEAGGGSMTSKKGVPKTRTKKVTSQAGSSMTASMTASTGHSYGYRSPSSTFRTSRMSRAPSSSDTERREASETPHKSNVDNAERESRQQDEDQGLRAAAPSPSPHKNGSNLESQDGHHAAPIPNDNAETLGADETQRMPPPPAVYGRRTRRNDAGGGTSTSGTVEDQVSSFLAADRAASSGGGSGAGSRSMGTSSPRKKQVTTATEFSSTIGGLDGVEDDPQRMGSNGASSRKKSEAMKGKRKAAARA